MMKMEVQTYLSNILLLKINQSKFESIPQKYRLLFDLLKAEPEDDDLFKDDELYIGLMKKYRKASKELRDYKFDKRNK